MTETPEPVRLTPLHPVIPAQARIHPVVFARHLDSRLRGNDGGIHARCDSE